MARRKFSHICPPRFRTRADAMLFMECVRDKKPFPKEKWVHPFMLQGDMIVRNPEYRDAAYEEVFL